MNIVARTLLYLSKTDSRLVGLCSDSAYKTQVGYGIFVLIVGIFAFTSSSYALRTTLSDSYAVFAVAAVYAALIMFIDREIVAATSKGKVMLVTRLVLAVFIGLVVSVPIELKLFEKQIIQQQKRIENAQNAPYLERKQQAEAQYRERIVEKDRQIQALGEEAGDLESRITNEVLQPDRQIPGVARGTLHPGAGPVFRRLKEQAAEKAEQLTQARAAYDKLNADEQAELGRLEREYGRQAVPPADDLLSRYIALGAVKQDPQKGADAWAMAWGVRLLLILLELTPALIKVLQEENEYDAILQANRRRSITRIYAIANDHMEQLAQNGGDNPTPTLLEQLKTDPLTS
ncbi:MAG: DUF4407 domain-containing protein [Acidobacteria bacterium]|nr:DUF4407 domain-containing protein [Acidobacteriota bacterium]